jgi:hypothetical protein
MAQCHIQWLYLAVHGCKTYLNLNLNPVLQTGGTFNVVAAPLAPLVGLFKTESCMTEWSLN